VLQVVDVLVRPDALEARLHEVAPLGRAVDRQVVSIGGDTDARSRNDPHLEREEWVVHRGAGTPRATLQLAYDICELLIRDERLSGHVVDTDRLWLGWWLVGKGRARQRGMTYMTL
jgi:hypothetical protein